MPSQVKTITRTVREHVGCIVQSLSTFFFLFLVTTILETAVKVLSDYERQNEKQPIFDVHVAPTF